MVAALDDRPAFAGRERRGERATLSDPPLATSLQDQHAAGFAGASDGWLILRRAFRSARTNNVTLVAQALAYSLFLTIPAALPRPARRLLAVADEMRSAG